MALQLEYTKKDQTSGNYWRINKIDWDTLSNELNLIVALYKDADARTNYKNFPMKYLHINLKNEQHPLSLEFTQNTSNANLTAAFYNLLKSSNSIRDEYGYIIAFNTAIDV